MELPSAWSHVWLTGEKSGQERWRAWPPPPGRDRRLQGGGLCRASLLPTPGPMEPPALANSAEREKGGIPEQLQGIWKAGMLRNVRSVARTACGVL